jgi:hypothetical protein
MTSKMRERYEGAFLDALDLPEGVEVPVEIASIVEPGVEMDSAKKLIKSAIVAFKGKHKRLILNKTNYKNLKAMFGEDSRKWIGQPIVIQRRYLDAQRGFGVNNTLAIRIIPPVGTSILRSAANYMGSVTPYGPDGKPMPRRHQKAEVKPVDTPQEAPEPAEKPVSSDDPELAQWIVGVNTLQSPESCQEFREQVLPECPERLRTEIGEALKQHERTLTHGGDKE